MLKCGRNRLVTCSRKELGLGCSVVTEGLALGDGLDRE